jgi:hypothetical protein
MKKLQTLIYLLAFFVVLAAKADLSDSLLVPQEEMKFAKDYLEKIRTRNFDYALSHIDTELSEQVSDEKLEEIAAYFPTGQLLSTELIGSQVNTFNDTWEGNFSFEYEFQSGWSVANVVLKRVDSITTVIGFNVYRTSASQKELNEFVLPGKTIQHYLVLVLACIVPVFIVITLIYCVKTPMLKRKWLWVLFVVGGIGTISINWTTGLYEFKILQYQLLGVGATAVGEYAPWMITAGFPLGAIVFWFKRNSFIEQGKANKSIQQDASEAGASD